MAVAVVDSALNFRQLESHGTACSLSVKERWYEGHKLLSFSLGVLRKGETHPFLLVCRRTLFCLFQAVRKQQHKCLAEYYCVLNVIDLYQQRGTFRGAESMLTANFLKDDYF